MPRGKKNAVKKDDDENKTPSNADKEKKIDDLAPPFFESSIDHNSTPFAGFTDAAIPTMDSRCFYNLTANDFDESMIPQGESTVIAKSISKPDGIEELKTLFKDFQTSVLSSISDRDNVLKNDMVAMKQTLNIVMQKVKQNDDELQTMRHSHPIASTCQPQNPIRKLSNAPNILPIKQQPGIILAPTAPSLSVPQQQIRIETNSNIPSMGQPVRNAPNQNESQIDFANPNLYHKKIYDLPNFDGKPEDWPMFLSSFNETTSTYAYSNLENSMRLRKCLSGAALESVKSMMVHPDNVPEIINELKFRFGRSDLLVKSQMQLIRQLPCIKDDDLSGLISFSTKLRNLVSFLKTADAVRYLQNPSLLEELSIKLPLQRQISWAEHLMNTNNENPSIDDFSAWISRVARVVSLVEPNSIATSSQNKPISHKRSMVANEVKYTPKCYYCENDHYINKCDKFRELSLNQRWSWVKESSVCFGCLRKGHRITDCRVRRRCGIDNCKLNHHSMLHEVKSKEKSNSDSTAKTVSSEKSIVLSLHHSVDKVYFRVVPVTLFGRNKRVQTFALLDEGSSMTIIEEELMKELNLDGEKTKLTMQWLNDGVATEDTMVSDCFIQGTADGCEKLLLKNVHSWKNLVLPCQTVNLSELNALYPQLRGIPMHSFENAKPRLLIGLDNCRLGFAKSYIDCPPSGPIAVETALGWVLYGPSSGKLSKSTNHVLFASSEFHAKEKEQYDELYDIVTNYYEMENFGVKPPTVMLESADSVRAREILRKSTRYTGKFYETALLWKRDEIEMPNSYSMALRRLHNLEKKMNIDLDYGDKYRIAVNDFIEKGYARKLSDIEASKTSAKTWYLPHFGVINLNKPKKIRLVFDAAAAVNRISLNSQLLKGPDLNEPLISVLSKFREKSIAVCADIQEMFCRVKILTEDRQAQRFLWRDGNENEPVDMYEMVSMIFGATSSPTTAQFIKNINAEKFQNEFPDAVNAVLRHHYVDDYVMSFDRVEDAIEISSQVKTIHKAADFNLRNFVSNSEDVMRALSDEIESAGATIDFNTDISHSEKVLGMYWKYVPDEFVFQFKLNKIRKEVLEQTRSPSKREILSIVMSIFDPFGYLANIHIYAKIILQSLWNMSLDWDDQLPDDVAMKWYAWQSKLESISNIRIPRCYFTLSPEQSNVQLHIFVDASMDAYAAVSYWRRDDENSIDVAFIYGKARVGPRKMMSIPRMELQAAVLGIRMKESVLNSHTIIPSQIFFWSDSKTLLQWINSDSRNYKPFVAHRISEILEHSSESNWYWLPSDMNVADEATRGKIPANIDNNSRWLKGPAFLHEKVIQIPKQPTDLSNAEIYCEKRSKGKIMIAKPQPASIIDVNKFSRYNRLKRVLAWFSRAIKIFLSHIKSKNITKNTGELNVIELEAAEQQLCRMVQQEVFADDYARIKLHNSISPKSQLYNLTPYIDENDLLRIQGRIDAATVIPLSSRRPIILPKNHHVTNLIIAYYHEKYLHANQETVICKIREKFWIPHIRHQLNSVRHKCQKCKNDRSKPRQPAMGSLPYDRLAAYVRPFTFTGLDYFGPTNVAIGRRREKRWVAIFTCLTTRAIHLELATDLSTDACILCLRNFFNIRGVPTRIRSDNGTNFIGLDKELKNITDFLDVDTIQREMSGFGIEWWFNSPHDPSAGGVWERMVQSVKRSLNATLQERVPREDTLRSLLLEAANIVNSRPLTHLPVGSDAEEPLTPNHFLIGDINSTQTPGPINEKLLCLRKQWRISQQLKNHFYKRWIEEYLPILTRRSKWFENVPPLQIGDLVLICETEQPRSRWCRGRIVKTYEGKDGQVRTADVKTVSGVFRRPASKLAKLDVVNPVCSREGECR